MKANGTPPPDEPPLAGALRACPDFRDAFADVGTSITDGTTLMAAVDWPAAITARYDGYPSLT
jgi:hypothetical protein